MMSQLRYLSSNSDKILVDRCWSTCRWRQWGQSPNRKWNSNI